MCTSIGLEAQHFNTHNLWLLPLIHLPVDFLQHTGTVNWPCKRHLWLLFVITAEFYHLCQCPHLVVTAATHIFDSLCRLQHPHCAEHHSCFSLWQSLRWRWTSTWDTEIRKNEILTDCAVAKKTVSTDWNTNNQVWLQRPRHLLSTQGAGTSRVGSRPITLL